MVIFTANTKIKSADVNANFAELASGTGDADGNSLILMRRQEMVSHVVSGLAIATSGTLASTISAGIAIVNGKYVSILLTNRTFTASKDTYVFLKDDGTFVYSEVANGATAPSTVTNSDGSNALLIGIAVTSGAAVASVQQVGFDTANRMIYRTRKLYLVLTADETGGATSMNDVGRLVRFASGSSAYGRGTHILPDDIDTTYPSGRLRYKLSSASTQSKTFSYYISGNNVGDNPASAWNIASNLTTGTWAMTASLLQEFTIDLTSTPALKPGTHFSTAIAPLSNTANIDLYDITLEYRPNRL